MKANPQKPYEEVKKFYDLMQNLDEKNCNKRQRIVEEIVAKRIVIRKYIKSSSYAPKPKTINKFTKIPLKIKQEKPMDTKSVKSTKGWLHGVNIGERVWVDDKLYEVVNVKSNTSTLKIVEPSFFQWLVYLIKKIGNAIWKSL